MTDSQSAVPVVVIQFGAPLCQLMSGLYMPMGHLNIGKVLGWLLEFLGECRWDFLITVTTTQNCMQLYERPGV